jgi:hypothetical protein
MTIHHVRFHGRPGEIGLICSTFRWKLGEARPKADPVRLYGLRLLLANCPRCLVIRVLRS